MRSLSCARRLHWNKIGDQGATAIAKALEVNGALKLKQLFVGSALSGHALLKAACKEKGVRLD